jgi:hypothetical protein
VTVWDTSDWSEFSTWHAADNLHDHLAVSFDGRFVAVMLGSEVKVRDFQTGSVVTVANNLTGAEFAFVRGSDGEGPSLTLLTRETLSFVDPTTGKQRWTPR